MLCKEKTKDQRPRASMLRRALLRALWQKSNTPTDGWS